MTEEDQEPAGREEQPFVSRLMRGGARAGFGVAEAAGATPAIDAAVEEAIVRAIESPAIERAVVRLAEEGRLQEVIERAVVQIELEEMVSQAIDSEVADRIWADLLASDKAQMLVERVANAPEVRNAITAQGFGLITDIGRRISKITEALDDVAERIACRVLRRPEGDAETNQAGLATRLAARAIDGGILFVTGSILSGLLASVGSAAFDLQGISLGAALILLTLAFFGIGGYLVLFWWLVGQTPGMRFLGIRLQHEGETEISLRRALRRLFALIPSLVPAGLGMLAILTSAKRQAWHDRLAGTEVIYDEASAPWSFAPREWAEGDQRGDGRPAGSSRAADGEPGEARRGDGSASGAG